MIDRGAHHASRVSVRELIENAATMTCATHEQGAAQNPELLGDMRASFFRGIRELGDRHRASFAKEHEEDAEPGG